MSPFPLNLEFGRIVGWTPGPATLSPLPRIQCPSEKWLWETESSALQGLSAGPCPRWEAWNAAVLQGLDPDSSQVLRTQESRRELGLSWWARTSCCIWSTFLHKPGAPEPSPGLGLPWSQVL